jgi:hypothetical protein
MLSNSDRTLFIVAGVAFLLFVVGIVVGHPHESHIRELGSLQNPSWIQCGGYMVIKADDLISPIIVYKNGRVLGLNQLHYEFVKDFDCSYEIVEVYNE